MGVRKWGSGHGEGGNGEGGNGEAELLGLNDNRNKVI